MTRRNLIMGGLLLSPAAFSTQESPAALRNEFHDLMNEFVACWGELVAAEIRGKWDLKAAEKVEQAFKRVTDHPMWLRRKR